MKTGQGRIPRALLIQVGARGVDVQGLEGRFVGQGRLEGVYGVVAGGLADGAAAAGHAGKVGALVRLVGDLLEAVGVRHVELRRGLARVVGAHVAHVHRSRDEDDLGVSRLSLDEQTVIESVR
jgi:hypothetical protein